MEESPHPFNPSKWMLSLIIEGDFLAALIRSREKGCKLR
jgi:hypothetical protein